MRRLRFTVYDFLAVSRAATGSDREIIGRRSDLLQKPQTEIGRRSGLLHEPTARWGTALRGRTGFGRRSDLLQKPTRPTVRGTLRGPKEFFAIDRPKGFSPPQPETQYRPTERPTTGESTAGA